MNGSAFISEIESIPDLMRDRHTGFSDQAGDLAKLFSEDYKISQVLLTGCGDSHHAAVATRLAFQQLTDLPCYALTAMELARYQVSQIAIGVYGKPLVIAISSSGQVSRTIEALAMAKHYGAIPLAITGNMNSELASVADHVFDIEDNFPGREQSDRIIPGTRSYYQALLALYHLAIHLGAAKRIGGSMLRKQRLEELFLLAEQTQQTMAAAKPKIVGLVKEWSDANRYVFCGSGPNLGTAMFSAAKMIEACGEPAIAQDLEEWTHLQYFEKEQDTPTIVISAYEGDGDRALEVITAAHTIGRRLAVIAPQPGAIGTKSPASSFITVAGQVKEHWSPLLTAIPGLYLAAFRAQYLSEPYFRGFAGGRSKAGGGGISRIRDSHRIDG